MTHEVTMTLQFGGLTNFLATVHLLRAINSLSVRAKSTENIVSLLTGLCY